jgi:hypothetical protein
VRTDLALTGMMFRDDTDFEIETGISPLDQGRCLREDASDLTAMGLAEAGRRFPLPRAAAGKSP